MKQLCGVCGQPLYEKRGHCPNCGAGFNFRDKPKKKDKKRRDKKNDAGVAQW